MWTNTVAPEKDNFHQKRRPGFVWGPNHFVPLVDEEMKNVYVPVSITETPQLPEVNEEPISVDIESPNRFEALRQETETYEKNKEVARKQHTAKKTTTTQVKRKTSPAPQAKRKTSATTSLAPQAKRKTSAATPLRLKPKTQM